MVEVPVARVSYDLPLVFLSWCMVVFATHSSMLLVDESLKTKSKTMFHIWTIIASLSLGLGGIYSMHYIAMDALTLVGIPTQLHNGITVASGVISALTFYPAMLLVGVAAHDKNTDTRSFGKENSFLRISIRVPRRRRALLPLGGIFLGAGIFGLHFCGASAMSSPVPGFRIEWMWYMVLHLVFAMAVGTIGLAIIYHLVGTVHRFISSFVIGIAACGVHYAGIKVVRYWYDSSYNPDDGVVVEKTLWLSLAVAAISTFLRFVATAMLQGSFFLERTYLRSEVNRLQDLLSQYTKDPDMLGSRQVVSPFGQRVTDNLPKFLQEEYDRSAAKFGGEDVPETPTKPKATKAMELDSALESPSVSHGTIALVNEALYPNTDVASSSTPDRDSAALESAAFESVTLDSTVVTVPGTSRPATPTKLRPFSAMRPRPLSPTKRPTLAPLPVTGRAARSEPRVGAAPSSLAKPVVRPRPTSPMKPYAPARAPPPPPSSNRT